MDVIKLLHENGILNLIGLIPSPVISFFGHAFYIA